MQRRKDLADGEDKIEAFLTDLAVNGRVAPATQNQAMNALVFLYKKVLEVPLSERIDAVRAERKSNVPVVLTREVVAGVISRLEETPHLGATAMWYRVPAGGGGEPVDEGRGLRRESDHGAAGKGRQSPRPPVAYLPARAAATAPEGRAGAAPRALAVTERARSG